MVELLAHRGVWRERSEGNTRAALAKALEAGLGIETDVRDVDGKLMIAHDANDPTAYPAADFVADIKRLKVRPTIALNIKADGLQDLISQTFADSGARLLLFDMSVCDHWRSLKKNLPCLSRLSDIEPNPVLTTKSQGLWIDAMDGDWLTADRLRELFGQYAGKNLVLVSPELHGRPHRAFWSMVKSVAAVAKDVRLALCTDLTDEAKAFFA